MGKLSMGGSTTRLLRKYLAYGVVSCEYSV